MLYSGSLVTPTRISPTRLSRSLTCFPKQFDYSYDPIPPGPPTPQDYLRFGLCRFRSPLLTVSISLSFPPLTEMFHFSGSRVHNPMCSGYVNSPCRLLGYPIRIPPDLRSLATPRGFSQLAASFFAGRLQGIPHKPFSCSRSRAHIFPSPPCAASSRKTSVLPRSTLSLP